jgi:RNA polymerase sigma-70 factor (ECF subfamily)
VFPILILLALEIPDDTKRIAQKIRMGDAKAFKFFFDVHNKQLYRFLIQRRMREEVAQDLVQQAFIWIWEHRTEIDPEKSLKAYLFKIGYTRMLNQIRDNQKNTSLDVYELDVQTSSTADSELINSELKDKIYSAIAQMPDKRRTVFEFCYLQEMSYKQVAEILEMSVKTVENHMGLALKYLRETLVDANN